MPQLHPAHRASRWQRLPIYLFAFLVPPLTLMLLIGTSTFSSLNKHRAPDPIDPQEAAMPAPPTLVPSRKTVVILLSQGGTQLTEVLVSHELLSRVSSLQVVTCGPIRDLTATTGPVGILPDFDLEHCPKAAAIVLPSMTDPNHAKRIEWLKQNAPHAEAILMLGEGALSAAWAGLTLGKSVATRFSALEELKREFPDTRWEVARTITDGKLLSGEGALSSFAAIENLIERIASASAAKSIRTELNWPDAPTHAIDSLEPAAQREFLPLIRNATLFWWRRSVAVILTPGLDPIRLAIVLDPLPRSMKSQAYTLADYRSYVPTHGGLLLIPSTSVGLAEVADVLISTGGSAIDAKSSDNTSTSSQLFKESLIGRWQRNNQVTIEDYSNLSLSDFTIRFYRMLDSWDGRDTSLLIARSLQMPGALREAWLSTPLPQTKPRTALPILVLVGALGVLLVGWFDRRRFTHPGEN